MIFVVRNGQINSIATIAAAAAMVSLRETKSITAKVQIKPIPAKKHYNNSISLLDISHIHAHTHTHINNILNLIRNKIEARRSKKKKANCRIQMRKISVPKSLLNLLKIYFI